MSVCRATIEGNDDDGSLTKIRECKLKKEATLQLTGALVDNFPDVWYVSEIHFTAVHDATDVTL
jgi:hypothetical protein